MAGAVQSSPPCFEPPTREAALSIVALAATLLFAHGVTTERTVVTAERLGRALGVPVRVLPDWGELIVEIEGTSLSQIVPTKPLGVDMNRVLAITTVVDRLCEGTLCGEEARRALLLAGDLLPVSTLRFTSFAAIGATSLGVIFGALDATSLMLIAASAVLGALVRRWLSGFSSNLSSSRFVPPSSPASWRQSPLPACISRSQRLSSHSVPAWCWCLVRIFSTVRSISYARGSRLPSLA
jgi:uncharacterized membrane protein YjjP (DUF1212 family)